MIFAAGVKGQGNLRSARSSNTKSREIILTDVSVSLPNSQIITETVEFGQEVEIEYVTKGDNNSNSGNENRLEPDQENIEPSGPVRVLNFNDSDEKSSQNSGIHRPKPVLPNGAYKKVKDSVLDGSSKESNGDRKQQKQSAFARVVKDKKQNKEEKALPGEKELGIIQNSSDK